MTELRGLVVADDLTGATDTGNEFAARGHATLVALRPDAAPGDAGVFVANTESRYASPANARQAVVSAVRSHEADVVYKKIDSTLRGNVVTEVDAAIEAAEADLGLVAPAFPRNGRRTADGYHLVDGELVTDTAAGRDPDKPVTDAHLPTMFADSVYPVEHLGVDLVASGETEIRQALESAVTDGPVVVVADAIHESHLDAIGAGAAASGLDIVYVGSAGLARHVRLPDPEPDERPARTPAEAGPPSATESADRRVLGVAGSVNPQTVAQLDAVPTEQVVPLAIETAILAPDDAAEDAAARCLETMDATGAAIVTSVHGEDPPERALRIGGENGIDERTVRERIAETLALTASVVWDRSPPDGVFLTGGAVAIEVLDELDATGISLSGEEVTAGVPLGRVAGGRADDTPVVTKAGAFGERETITNCLARLRGEQ